MKRNYKGDRTLRSRLSEPYYNPTKIYEGGITFNTDEGNSGRTGVNQVRQNEVTSDTSIDIHSQEKSKKIANDTVSMTGEQGAAGHCGLRQITPELQLEKAEFPMGHCSDKVGDIYPFGTFCRRGNYCPKCSYECKQREHIRKTKELFDNILTWKWPEE